MAGFTWNSNAALEAKAREEALAALRAERDRLLAGSDWTQLPDSPLAVEEREAWAVYRQALRDLPAAAEVLADPRSVSWPQPPGGHDAG